MAGQFHFFTDHETDDREGYCTTLAAAQGEAVRLMIEDGLPIRTVLFDSALKITRSRAGLPADEDLEQWILEVAVRLPDESEGSVKSYVVEWPVGLDTSRSPLG